MNCNLHAKINPLLPKLLVIEVFDHSGPKGTRASLSLIWWRKKSELRNGKWFTEGTPAPCWTHSSSTHTFSTFQWDFGILFLSFLLGALGLQNRPQEYTEVSIWFSLLRWKIFRRNSKEQLVRKENERAGPRPRRHTQAVDMSAFREGFFSVWRADDQVHVFVCGACAHMCTREWRQVALSLVCPLSSGHVPSDFPLGWREDQNVINGPQGFRTQLVHIRALSWSWTGGAWTK